MISWEACLSPNLCRLGDEPFRELCESQGSVREEVLLKGGHLRKCPSSSMTGDEDWIEAEPVSPPRFLANLTVCHARETLGTRPWPAEGYSRLEACLSVLMTVQELEDTTDTYGCEDV